MAKKKTVKTAVKTISQDEISEIISGSLEALLETLFEKGACQEQSESFIDEISETILEAKYQDILDELYQD